MELWWNSGGHTLVDLWCILAEVGLWCASMVDFWWLIMPGGFLMDLQWDCGVPLYDWWVLGVFTGGLLVDAWGQYRHPPAHHQGIGGNLVGCFDSRYPHTEFRGDRPTGKGC